MDTVESLRAEIVNLKHTIMLRDMALALAMNELTRIARDAEQYLSERDKQE